MSTARSACYAINAINFEVVTHMFTHSLWVARKYARNTVPTIANVTHPRVVTDKRCVQASILWNRFRSVLPPCIPETS